MITRKARVIAYYLPQFHPVPENDKFWGKGFTEWTNVKKAIPLFKGHYQPRVPADLGYYDLRRPEVRESQAKMACEAGIEGFMYWHYWFGKGRTILERPFNEVLRSGKPTYPFCLGWANHSWTTNTWSNSRRIQKDRIMINQEYPDEKDIINHFNYLLPAFTDDRYITVNNKPIFLIYDPLAIPDNFLEIWRKLALNHGLEGIHIVGLANGWPSDFEKILDFGYNALNTNGQWFAESIIKGRIQKLLVNYINKNLRGIMLDKYPYKKIIKHLYSEIEKKENVYPTILSQWDRSARAGKRAVIYHGSTPEYFRLHVKQAISLIEHKPIERRIIFLKSWNEWGEGNYVEPDTVHGLGYLNVLKEEIFH